ncbi:MAG: glycosyl transferase family 1, partial [Verrucomicrobiales bacterium]|nr:glycosyl transferase family 1 [Verrucomicrobiales bacterium]
MKICMMTNTFLPHVGGVARSIQTFSENYLRKGHQVLIVAPTFTSEEKVPDEIEAHTVRLAAIEQFNGTDFSIRLPLTGLYNDRVWDFEPHIIHSHHPFLIGDTA